MMERNRLITFLQTWGILLVVLGHSIPDEGYYRPLSTWIYAFHMPLFMAISGWLLCYGLKRKNLKMSDIRLYGAEGFVAKKAKRLLLPYFAISSAWFIPKAMMGSMAGRSVELSWSAYFHQLLYPWDNVVLMLWFLPTLFIVMMTIVFCAKFLNINKITLPIWLSLALLAILNLIHPFPKIRFLNFGDALSYLVWFMLGYVACRLEWAEKIEKRCKTIAVLTGIVSLIPIFLPSGNEGQLLFATNGMALSIALGHLYIRNNGRFLDHLAGASFTIYLFSWFPQGFVSRLACPTLLKCALAFLLGTYFPLALRWLWQRRPNLLRFK